jgi:hypothetical protein
MILPMLMSLQTAQPLPRCGGATLADAVGAVADRTRAMETARLAAMFGATGDSVMGGRTLVGEQAIGAYLAGFAGYRVTAETMTIASIEAQGSGWRTLGRFVQQGATPDGKPYASAGRFTIDWTCDPDAGWRIRHMETTAD